MDTSLYKNDLLYPFLMILLFQAFIHLLKNDFQITDYPSVIKIFIHLRACDLRQTAGFLHPWQFLSISCHTVTESCSCYNQKITFTDSVIGCFCAMHSKHSGIQRIRSRECTFPIRESVTGASTFFTNSYNSLLLLIILPAANKYIWSFRLLIMPNCTSRFFFAVYLPDRFT